MAFDDLKRIAGIHTGAAPSHPLLKIPAHAAPTTAAHPLAPVQRIAMNPSAPVQRPAPAPAPAPMPKLGAAGNTAPPRHFSIPGASAAIPSHASPSLPSVNHTPLSVSHLAAASPTLASLAAAAGIVAASSGSSSASLPSMISTSSSDTAPSSGGGSQLVDRAPSAPQASSQSLAGAGSEARGFERVARSAARPKSAQGMPPLGTTETRGGTTKGRTTMGSYRGTGEKTYCPINSAGNVAANSQATLPGVRPSKPFQGQKLLIDPSLWAVFNIVDIKLGNEPVAVTAGAVSAGCFPPANGPSFEWKVADGVDVIFTVANVTATATPFSALILGEVCEKTA